MKFDKLKKICTGICALALGACSMSLGAFAEEGVMKGNDENTLAQAGVVWMIQDQWDHRNNVGLEPYDELEENVISCTHDDVNITGDGEYEVSFKGYYLPADQAQFYVVGNLAVGFLIDLEKYPDFKAEISECTIDGTTYTVNEQPELEDQSGLLSMKLKNSYGQPANTTPEMDNSLWATGDPITIKFSVTGMGQEKMADNPNEVIETVYGNGSVDNDLVEEDVVSSELSSVAQSETASIGTTASNTSTADSSKVTTEDSSVNWMLYGCIAGGIVIVIIVVVIIAKKKS